MSYSSKHVNDPGLMEFVTETYTRTDLTQAKIAENSGVTPNTVSEIIKRNFTREEILEWKSRRYRNSKLGEKNPALGKRPPNYIGDFDDGKGYKKRYVDDVQHFVHRISMAEAIGIPVGELPPELDVHHIDRNPHNNDLSNLALVSKSAHRKLHAQLRKIDRLEEPQRVSETPPPISSTRAHVTPLVRKRRPPNVPSAPDSSKYPPVRRRTLPVAANNSREGSPS